MPSEREIRNLYVNGRTICIEVFFCFLKFFSVRRTRSRHRMGTILGAWGESLNKHFGRCNPAKIAKHVYVCIACQSVKTAYEYNWISNCFEAILGLLAAFLQISAERYGRNLILHDSQLLLRCRQWTYRFFQEVPEQVPAAMPECIPQCFCLL